MILTNYSIEVKIYVIIHYTTGCIDRMYGVDCSRKCGACVDNEACHYINGSCMKGCEKGYYGQQCDKGNSLLAFYEGSSLFSILFIYLNNFLEGYELFESLPFICCKSIKEISLI